MRRAAKVDSSQRPIVEALRGVGAKVWIVGQELDLVVLFRGDVYLMDAKAGRGSRTATQTVMLRDGWPISFPTTPEEALRAIGAIR